jgi:hypothetical protein
VVIKLVKMRGNMADTVGVCHYFLRAGQIEYLDDCTHTLRGYKISLPALPELYRDKNV